MTPTARALAECKARGWLACVVEKWIPQTRQRKDAFGFGDLLVLDGKRGALLLQVTSDNGGDMARRATKIRGECGKAASAWLAAGNRIQVWGYGKRGPRGKRKVWTLREMEIESWDTTSGEIPPMPNGTGSSKSARSGAVSPTRKQRANGKTASGVQLPLFMTRPHR